MEGYYFIRQGRFIFALIGSVVLGSLEPKNDVFWGWWMPEAAPAGPRLELPLQIGVINSLLGSWSLVVDSLVVGGMLVHGFSKYLPQPRGAIFV